MQIPTEPVLREKRHPDQDEILLTMDELSPGNIFVAREWYYRGRSNDEDHWAKLITKEDVSGASVIYLTFETHDGNTASLPVHNGYEWIVKRDSHNP